MFTGLIECVGSVRSFNGMAGGKRLEISAPDLAPLLTIGDSIAIDGVCLTVTGIRGEGFSVDCLGETLKKTGISSLRPGLPVNLERAMGTDRRFDGHLVQGHVNGRGRIESIRSSGENRYLRIGLPAALLRHCIPEGSIAIQGISLTIASLDSTGLEVNIIPHTWNNSSLSRLRAGQTVNIETDVIGRYVERLLNRSRI